MANLHLAFVQAVNEPGQPVLTRDDVYRGLIALCRKPEVFTEDIAGCEISHDSNHCRRTLVFRNPAFSPPDGRAEQEVVLTPGHSFELTAVDTGNKVTNVIHEDITPGQPNNLSLSIDYNIPIGDVKSGSEEEKQLIEKYTAHAKRNLSSGIATIRDTEKIRAAIGQ